MLHVAQRIIKMFQYYSNTVNIEDKGFQDFLAKKLSAEIQAAPKSFSYSKLYENLKEIIDEFAKMNEGRPS